MIETKQCTLCCEHPPYRSCAAREDAITDVPVCARLVMYENVKLPQPWQQKCWQIAGTHITTNADIQAAMQEQIDELSAYAARLACDLLSLNGMIQKAARDAEGYIGAVHKAGKETV